MNVSLEKIYITKIIGRRKKYKAKESDDIIIEIRMNPDNNHKGTFERASIKEMIEKKRIYLIP